MKPNADLVKRRALAALVSNPWRPEEDEAVRQHYVGEGARAVARHINRSVAAIRIRARSMGLCRHRLWTSAEDDVLRKQWGVLPLTQIAKLVDRREHPVWMRANALGLGTGCPQGFEYLSHAAVRCGYALAQLRRILRWAKVRIEFAYSWSRKGAKPLKGLRRGTKQRIVEPPDVDEAVAKWVDSESAEAGAVRHGMCGQLLRKLAITAYITGDSRIPPPPARRAGMWRIPSPIIDELVAKYRSGELLNRAAKRVGITKKLLLELVREARPAYQPHERIDPRWVDELVAKYRTLETAAAAARRFGRCPEWARTIAYDARERGDVNFNLPRHKHLRLPRETWDALIQKHLDGEGGRRPMPNRTRSIVRAIPLARVA